MHEDNDWFFDNFEKNTKSMFREWRRNALFGFGLVLVFWLVIIAAIVIGVVIAL